MTNTHSLQLKDINSALDFTTAGNSIFTVVSGESGKRYTFRVRKLDYRTKKENQDPNAPLFVSYLNGSDNGSSYQFLGTIFGKNSYRYSKKSRAGFNSVVNKTFSFIFETLIDNNTRNFDRIEFWHEGSCGTCNRRLTDPVSILRGFGPVCRPMTADERKMKEREARLAGLFELMK